MELIQVVQEAVATVTLHAILSAIAVITLNTPALHPHPVSYIIIHILSISYLLHV